VLSETGRGTKPSTGRRLNGFRRVIVAVALLAVSGLWLAIQVQTDCEAAARQAFFGYADALNEGKATLAAQAFAGGGNFSWYSENPSRVGDVARDRDSLGDYLGDRVAQDARLRVLFFDFNAEAPANDLGHFGFYAFNESWNLISGKGAVSCEAGTLRVLSVGGA